MISGSREERVGCAVRHPLGTAGEPGRGGRTGPVWVVQLAPPGLVLADHTIGPVTYRTPHPGEARMPRPHARIVPFLVALLLGSVALGSLPATAGRAQDGEASPGTETLMRATVDGVPLAPSFVRLLRIVIEPGSTVPLHTHPGPEYNLVESGTLTVTSDAASVLVEAETGAQSTTPVDEAFDVVPGQTVVFPPETGFSFANEGEEPVQLLTVVILPAGPQRPPGIAYPNGDPDADAYAGVSNQVLGDGVATRFPEGPVSVVVERVPLSVESPLAASADPVLLSLADTGANLVITGGAVQVSRTANPGPQPNSDTGESYRLGVGDALFFPNGHREVVIPDDAEPVTLLRVTLTTGSGDVGVTGAASPEASPELGPVVVAEASPVADDLVGSVDIRGTGGATAAGADPEPADSEPTGEAAIDTGDTDPGATAPPVADDTAAPGAISIGSTVITNESEVNLRDAPSLGSSILAVLVQGQTFVIVSDPVEAEGFVWYEVQSLDDPNLRGFLAADFLDVV